METNQLATQPLEDYYAHPWQLGFSRPATAAMLGIVDLHHEIMFSLIVIAFIVGALLLALMRNPSLPANTLNVEGKEKQNTLTALTHCLALEMGWTILPAFILLTILIPSLSLVYRLDDLVTPAVTVKVLGKQWYWVYEYSDYTNPMAKFNNSLNFESRLIADDTNSFKSTAPLNLLRVDRAAVVPTHVNIRFLITSADVIHSFAVPSLGVKLDAMPGRLNQVLVNVPLEGNHWGQCSELCGMGHGFMPIQVQAVEQSKYYAWIVLCYFEQQLDGETYARPFSTDGVLEWLYLIAHMTYNNTTNVAPTNWLLFWQDQLSQQGSNTTTTVPGLTKFLTKYQTFLQQA